MKMSDNDSDLGSFLAGFVIGGPSARPPRLSLRRSRAEPHASNFINVRTI
jgi:hypothetical protein